MAAPPGEPQGLGTPSGDQPGFSAPTGTEPPVLAGQPSQPAWAADGRTYPQGPPDAYPPGQPQGASGPSWPAPDPGTRLAPPPSGWQAKTARGTRVTRTRLIVALLIGALALTGLLSALPLWAKPSPIPTPEVLAPPSVVTASPKAMPSDATTATSGGGIATSINFRNSLGDGAVTVRSAVWSSAGEMPPPEGERYLVLDVTLTCGGGRLPVDALFFVATGVDQNAELPAFGPKLANPLGGELLKAGQNVQGQVGFSLVPGPVTVSLLNEELQPIAKVEIPGP